MAKKIMETPAPDLSGDISLKEIGQCIRHVRTSNGMTITDAALMLGMSNTTVINIEKGTEKISVKNLFKAIHAFGISLRIEL